MGKVVSARAWANNEVAYVAWNIDGHIDECLGFDVTRIYLDGQGNVALRADGEEDRVKCAAWVAFNGQKNPLWLPQDTGVWPIQKLSWRDLTLRKKRDAAELRPAEVSVRYDIRPVGDLRAGLEAVLSNGREYAYVIERGGDTKPLRDEAGKIIRKRVRAYEGKRRALGYIRARSQFTRPANDVPRCSSRVIIGRRVHGLPGSSGSIGGLFIPIFEKCYGRQSGEGFANR
jgi:hypothetical protein